MTGDRTCDGGGGTVELSVEVSHDFAGEMSPWSWEEASGFSHGGIYPNRSLDTVEGLLPERAFC